MDEYRFDGRVAVITGAGGNPSLGRCYALLLASRGAKVLVNDFGVGPDGRGQVGPGVEAVVEEIRAAGGEALGDANSVAERDSAKTIVDTAVETWGRVDIVINNAGIAPAAKFDEITDRDIERVIGVHLMGHIWMCRAAWPHMVRQGYGRLVNVTSGVGFMGMPKASAYAAAKLGIVGLTRALANEGAEHGIKANVIAPFAITVALQTGLVAGSTDGIQAAGMVPEVVAPVAAWLAHEGCAFTGKVIEASGGSVDELFFARTNPTAPNPNLTIEDLPAALEQTMDRSQSEPYGDAADSELAKQMTDLFLPYETAPRTA